MIKPFTALVTLILSAQSFAHSRWIVPSHTVISGNETSSVVLDLSISNDIFHADNALGGLRLDDLHRATKEQTNTPLSSHPLAKIARSTRLTVSLPNGQHHHDTTIINFGRKSVAAVPLMKNGSYRIEVTQDPIYFVTYQTPDGNPHRIFGIVKKADKRLPDTAMGIKRFKVINRVETYVTRNQSTPITAREQDLELVFSHHPNDLFTQERSPATLYLNGQALPNTTLTITPGGTRYRNTRDMQTLLTNDKGAVNLIWEKPGLYLIEAHHETAVANEEYDTLVHGLYLTVEVFPE